jgi:hypothetical protein
VAKAFIPYSTKWGTNEIKAQMNRASFRSKIINGEEAPAEGYRFRSKGKTRRIKMELIGSLFKRS